MFASNTENSIQTSIKPIENMQANHIHGNNRQASALERQKTSMETTKIMSENERLDDQIRHGTDYINLPAQLYPTDKAPTWNPQQKTSNSTQIKPHEIRFLHHVRPSTAGSQIARHHYANHQQMDAENRLRHLDVIRPKENINLLNVKYRSLQYPRHARPTLPQYRDDYVNTFYDQTGTYVQERSGLYHTENYEPNSLVQAIPELENQQENYKYDDNLDDLLDKTEPKLFQYRAIGDYQNMRNHLLNKLRAPHDTGTIDSRTQEGNKQFVQRQSTYGQAYNTQKFLQENTLSYHARTNPTSLMSTRYNDNLERVRNLNSYPINATENPSVNNKQDKNNDALVSPVHRPPLYDEIYTTKSIAEHTDGYANRSTVRVYDSPFKNKYNTNSNQFYQQEQQTVQSQSNSFDPILTIPAQLPHSVKTTLRLPGPEMVARFIEPKLEPHTTYQRSFKDISYHESRLQKQGNNQPFIRVSDNQLKQWKLRDIQDRWSKTQAQQQYHIEHPEVVPDVGGNTIRAKKEILIADMIAKQGLMTVR